MNDWMLAQEDFVAEEAAYANRLHDTMQDTWGTMTQGANAALGGISTMTTSTTGIFNRMMADAMPFMRVILDDFIDEMMEVPRDKFGRKIHYTAPLPLPRSKPSSAGEAVRINRLQTRVSARSARPRSYERRRH